MVKILQPHPAVITPRPLMSIPRRRSFRFLDGATPAVIFALTLASGCGRAPGANAPAPAPAAPLEAVLVDAAKAEDVLSCAEGQYGARGYLVQRTTKETRSIRAQRETSTTGESYEVNVTRADLASVEGNPNLLRLLVSSETRMFPSRGYNVGYSLRATPRSDVVQLAQSVLETCSKW
jgi:hypothetical protein